jgi:hypothetical protein
MKNRNKPLVFICSPLAGNIENNMVRARGYCRFAVSKNAIPIAPHLLFPQFMDDDDPEQRNAAISMGLELLGKCQEFWCFGGFVSRGMQIELAKAKSLNMAIRYFTEKCEEVEVT